MLIMWLGMLYTNSLDVSKPFHSRPRAGTARRVSAGSTGNGAGGAAMPDTGDGVDGVVGEAGGRKPHKMQNFKCLMNEG